MQNISFEVRQKIEDEMQSANEETKAVLQRIIDFSEKIPSTGFFWNEEDVKSTAEELIESHTIDSPLTEEEVMEVLWFITENHDASYGICWDNLVDAIIYIKSK